MRQLYLLRGVPASGKSTWISTNKLEPYTISADKVRLLLSTPEINTDGLQTITQKQDKAVWELIFKTIEEKMERGELIIVDATHYKASLLQPYKELAKKYRYRMYVVDFMEDLTLEEAIRRNENRPQLQKVPREVIERMYVAIQDRQEVSSRFSLISPEEAIKNTYDLHERDVSEYEKIVVFGDIHGCYEPVKEYFEKNGFNDKNLYVFTGDYIDRGLQNKEVVEFLLGIYKKENVILLEGNHEKRLRMWSAKGYKEMNFESDEERKVIRRYFGSKGIKEVLSSNIKSQEFKEYTAPQLQGLPTKEIRLLCGKLRQVANLKFHDKTFCINHGGVPCVPYATVSTDQIIRGVGGYGDTVKVNKTWDEGMPTNWWQIHAHRNIEDRDILVNYSRCINLCDTIEAGGYLRIVEITKDEIKPIKIKNNLFRESERKTEIVNEGDFFDELRNSKLVQMKELGGDLYSFNFTRNAFRDKRWNELTVKARGLFVDMKERKVVARSFNKFMNYNETKDTTIVGLCKNLELPAQVYKKENGFLGVVSLYKGKLLVCSKSTNQGPFAQMMRDNLVHTLGRAGVKKLKNYLHEHDQSLVFECIDLQDRHIIKYDTNTIYLLEVFENCLEEKTLSYNKLEELASSLGCLVKELVCTLDTKEELVNFVTNVGASTDIKHEGYVIEGANHFRFKLKLSYYKFWKQIRTYLRQLQGGKPVDKKFASRDMIPAIQFMQKIPREELGKMDVIDVREAYNKSTDLTEI